MTTKKTNGKNGKTHAGGRPRQPNKNIWKSVLRLPKPLAAKLRKEAEKADVSINQVVETLVSNYVNAE